MDDLLYTDGNRLMRQYDAEKLCIEPWGVNSLRVRATYLPSLADDNWALLQQQPCNAKISIDDQRAYIENGKIRLEIDETGRMTFFNQNGQVLLQEYSRDWNSMVTPCALKISSRQFKPIPGGDYHLTVRFESNPEEKIFGMGQYQQPYLDMKNCTLELAQRNSQVSVPFALSSLGYGFLWHNPAIGRVVFGKNVTEWIAESTKQLDFWITAGDTPAEIEEAYAKATGTVPMMPEYAMGFWQCKLRYKTQNELLEVAREYKRRKLPISVIVVDFFHWTKQGEWKFDPDYWPDPDGMIRELNDMGIELMVSIWPTVDKDSENYGLMLQKGYLTQVERGIRTTMQFFGDTVFYDATNPAARDFLWRIVKKNYYDKGVRLFWLDEAEPEYSVYDFDNYRYYLGSDLQVGNIYPIMHVKTFFDGMNHAGQKNIINLIRCAWAGSQRYGALVWSGDIHSSFDTLRNQIRAGLNMAIAGIPWWTTDIGGFFGGNIEEPAFKELLIRWFQYGTFCPVFRLHGDRNPHPPTPPGNSGGGFCFTGAANEIWSYGEEVYEILKKYLLMRERLRPYITAIMKTAHEKGAPPMRPLFYDFPHDQIAWEIEDQFMFGPDILVCPVLYEGDRARKVYLPEGAHWKSVNDDQVYQGGQWLTCDAPLSSIPLFLRNEAVLPLA